MIKCWWDGGQVAQTLHGSLCGGGGVQYMPDKGNFGCVIIGEENDISEDGRTADGELTSGKL